MRVRNVARFALAFFVAGFLPTNVSTRSQRPVPHPGPTPQRIALELDGQVVGLVHSVSGGIIVGEVVSQPHGPTGPLDKRIGAVDYEPFAVEVDLWMSKAFYNWVSEAMTGHQTNKSGAVIFVDQKNHEVFRKKFSHAVITDVTFPALDRASKSPAFMTVGFKAASITYQPGNGVNTPLPPVPHHGQWLVSQFKVDLPGLPAEHVRKVDAFTLKLSTAGAPTPVTKVDVPNLALLGSYADFKPWLDWFDGMMAGKNEEKEGAIEFLSVAGKKIAQVTLTHVGIFDLEPANADVTAGLYVEAMQFENEVS